jgi:hypothetical protein
MGTLSLALRWDLQVEKLQRRWLENARSWVFLQRSHTASCGRHADWHDRRYRRAPDTTLALPLTDPTCFRGGRVQALDPDFGKSRLARASSDGMPVRPVYARAVAGAVHGRPDYRSARARSVICATSPAPTMTPNGRPTSKSEPRQLQLHLHCASCIVSLYVQSNFHRPSKQHKLMAPLAVDVVLLPGPVRLGISSITGGLADSVDCCG